MGNIYKEQFLENKKKITKCLDQTIAFMDELGDENRKNALIKQKNDLESGEFTIVVVGEFSAGSRCRCSKPGSQSDCHCKRLSCTDWRGFDLHSGICQHFN